MSGLFGVQRIIDVAIILVFFLKMFLPEVFRVGITSNGAEGPEEGRSLCSVAVEMENRRFPVVGGSGNVVASCFLYGIY